MSSRREVGRGRSCENVSLYSETAKEGHDQTQTEMAHPGCSGENGLKGVRVALGRPVRRILQHLLKGGPTHCAGSRRVQGQRPPAEGDIHTFQSTVRGAPRGWGELSTGNGLGLGVSVCSRIFLLLWRGLSGDVHKPGCCFSSCCWKTEGPSWLDARGLRRCLVSRWFYFRHPAWPWQALSRRLPVVPF